MGSYSAKAPAKINLFLHIVGKKDSGYHLVETVFAFTDLANFLYIRVDPTNFRGSDKVEFLNSKSKINIRYNTVIKAIRLLHRYAPSRSRVSVKVIKNIPIAAGLGSGSSDAGAVIRKLGELWNVDKTILNEIALDVGADVPASVLSKPAFAKGIGEELYPISEFNFPKHIVLIKPKNKSLKTAEIFSKYRRKFSEPIEWKEGNEKNLLEIVKNAKNDLQEVAIEVAPEIGEIISTLELQKGCIFARMSGSGSACFGVFDDADDASIAESSIKERHPEWWVYGTQLIC